MLLPFSLGYLLSYLFRAVNAIIAPNLVTDIGLSAGQLGFLTSVYLLAFAAFQLPLGVLLDRYGPRRVQVALFCCAASGSLIFALANSMGLLTLGRALIGLGFAGGLMAGFKAVVLWVPEPRRALANSCILTFGGIGIIISTLPAELAVQWAGWRSVFIGLTGATAAVALLILLIVPERSIKFEQSNLRQQLSGLRTILGDRVFWKIAPLVTTVQGSYIGIQTLWAGPWFRNVAQLDREDAAFHLMIMAVAFLVGTITTGVIADWLTRRGFDLLTVMNCFILLFFMSQIAIISELTSLKMLIWFVFGATGVGAIIAYPWMSGYFGMELSGRSNTAMNLLLFLFAFLVQYLIGEIIDLFPLSASGSYAPRGFQVSFGVFLIIQMTAFTWYLIDRPSYKSKDFA